MHRPALLEESPAVEDLSHCVQPLPIPEREHEHHTSQVGNCAGVEKSRARLFLRTGPGTLFFVDEFVGQNEKRETERQDPTRSGPGIQTAG